MTNPGEQPIIDSVPGMAPYEGPLSTDWSQQPSDGFQGDPSKVIGHPSNPFNGAGAAYAEYQNGQQEATGATPSPEAVAVGEKMLEGASVATTTEQSVASGAEKPRSWAQWVEDNPMSAEDARKIRENVDKNIQLSRMYGSAHFKDTEK